MLAANIHYADTRLRRANDEPLGWALGGHSAHRFRNMVDGMQNENRHFGGPIGAKVAVLL